ncbi:MAG TPA: LLM class flavin-dependent oxidoreductase [Solirubrobacteraceae bacterium]|jgi:alkanesulfonate monooxygenase SsuD/methylene tetrahydromethanopterin reductase-like flavin-dependent oxidoreductase (luciferase family)|nr:LLM class flavin-dependent oxidoreductase [Solirubrobacteraceae bacterium]
MKFGVLFKPMDPPNSEHLVERWSQALEAARVVEESGFDGVFIPEHHMMANGYPSSPWAALGALAAVTERIEVGTTIHLLPFEHPIHVAEHAAMADVIANGRIRIGVGMANFEPEFKLYGLDKKTQVSRFEESIDLVQRAWSGEVINHAGKHFTIEAEGPVMPRPIGAELWIGAMSDGGVKRAARFGCPWPTDPLHNIDVMKHWADTYRAAGVEHGTSEKLRVNLLRDGWVADSLEDVERVWWPIIRAEHWFYFENIPRWVAEFEPFLADVKTEDDFKFDNHLVDRLIVGSPEDCIASIRKFQDAIDMDYLIMTFRQTEGPGFEQELECIRRFGRDVIPAFS